MSITRPIRSSPLKSGPASAPRPTRPDRYRSSWNLAAGDSEAEGRAAHEWPAAGRQPRSRADSAGAGRPPNPAASAVSLAAAPQPSPARVAADLAADRPPSPAGAVASAAGDRAGNSKFLPRAGATAAS